MLHSSIVPIALPLSLIAGAISFNILQNTGLDPTDSLHGAEIVGGLVNLAIGIPKNLFLGDILSLVLVRPLSFLSVIGLLSHIYSAA